jgi:hypothetical protein
MSKKIPPRMNLLASLARKEGAGASGYLGKELALPKKLDYAVYLVHSMRPEATQHGNLVGRWVEILMRGWTVARCLDCVSVRAA